MTNAEIVAALRAMAKDIRRERPADWTPEEADERIARQLERLAAQIAYDRD
jgi:hypothetical protein